MELISKLCLWGSGSSHVLEEEADLCRDTGGRARRSPRGRVVWALPLN